MLHGCRKRLRQEGLETVEKPVKKKHELSPSCLQMYETIHGLVTFVWDTLKIRKNSNRRVVWIQSIHRLRRLPRRFVFYIGSNSYLSVGMKLIEL